MTRHIERKRIACKLAILTSIAGLVLSEPASAQQFEHPIRGGNGGGFFKITCPPNTFWVGLQGQAGAVIDHMRLLCAPFTTIPGGPRKNWRIDRSKIFNQGEVIGESPGGGSLNLVCTGSRFVRLIEFNTEFFEDKHLVAFVRMTCDHGTLSGEDVLPFGFNFPVGVGPAVQGCPDGMWAIGLRGRRGSFVDAIGLVCAPMP